MLPLSQLMHTHAQVLVTQKPAGGSNSAKARLPKFVMTPDFKKRRQIESETSLQIEGLSVVVLSSPGICEFCSDNSPQALCMRWSWRAFTLVFCVSVCAYLGAPCLLRL